MVADLSKYPPPWVVGPFGCIWVAADVEVRDGRWCETRAEPRLVVSMAIGEESLAQAIVDAVNAAHAPKKFPPPPY